MPCCAIFFATLLCIIYFFKPRINLLENKFYSIILIVIVLDSILATSLQLLGIDGVTNFEMILVNIFNKLDFICLIIYSTCLFLYTLLITDDKAKKVYKPLLKILIVINIILIISMLLTPIKLISSNNNYSITGISAMITFFTCGTYVFLSIAVTFLNVKKINKKHIPIVLTTIIILFILILFLINPYLVVISITLTFINYIMYFTIENPDLKMIDELQKNKSLVETSMEDKSLFLFKMSQDIKQPVKNISSLIKEYNTNKLTKEEINNNYHMIENNINNLNFIINDVINVSDIDISKVKVVNTTYDVNNLFDSISKLAENNLKEKQDIEYRYNISSVIPKELYGDYIKLKQIITTILNNSIKYTNKGLIELDVDAITRYDLCRLIIKISDTGKGMSLDQINDILRNNYEFEEDEYEKLDNLHLNLEMAIKLIRILGGNINIKSDVEYGTEITIILDQKVKLEEKSETTNNINKYTGSLFNNKVLIVDDNSEELNKIVKILSKGDIPTNIAMYGKECIDKIKSGEKYKIILMDDEMKPDNALPTLEELKKIKKFNIPVIIMINKEKEFIKEHYIKDGFTDYILKDNMDKELEKIINKYL